MDLKTACNLQPCHIIHFEFRFQNLWIHRGLKTWPENVARRYSTAGWSVTHNFHHSLPLTPYPCTSSLTNAISQKSLFTRELLVEILSIASPKFDNLGSKFLSSKILLEFMLRSTTRALEPWWSHARPLATPTAIEKVSIWYIPWQWRPTTNYLVHQKPFLWFYAESWQWQQVIMSQSAQCFQFWYHMFLKLSRIMHSLLSNEPAIRKGSLVHGSH